MFNKLIIAAEHPYLVRKLLKPAKEIMAENDQHKAHLTHMALGIAGEAGELVDAIKKYAIYNQKLDVQNVKEELGDLLFYMQGILQYLECDLADIAYNNTMKLQKRYPNRRFTNEDAKLRRDK